MLRLEPQRACRAERGGADGSVRDAVSAIVRPRRAGRCQWRFLLLFIALCGPVAAIVVLCVFVESRANAERDAVAKLRSSGASLTFFLGTAMWMAFATI